jgi:hypothetical protein
VTSKRGLLPELPKFFDLLGGDSWTVYRFLTQLHPELEGDTALSALQRGKISRVLAAAENASSRVSRSVPNAQAIERAQPIASCFPGSLRRVYSSASQRDGAHGKSQSAPRLEPTPSEPELARASLVS